MKPILVIAGEASGDLHGAEIMKAIKILRPDVRLVGVGGAFMTPLLDRKLADISDLSVMGLFEVIGHLPKLKRLFDRILAVAVEECIGGVLLVDYPGFNIRLAKALKRVIPRVRVHQFVCPQVWAWKAGRIPTLGNVLDVIYCLFDFEPKLFTGYPVEAVWLGNPIVETAVPEVSRDEFFLSNDLDPNRKLVALLPGSRMNEIKHLMPPLVELVLSWQDTQERRAIQWVIPVASTIQNYDLAIYTQNTNIKLVNGFGYASRAYADAAIVCSGTATLETAILGTPFIALYKLNKLTYFIARRLVNIPYFSLANIVAGYGLIPELLQGNVNARRLSAELSHILEPDTGACMRFALGNICKRLGESGSATRVACHMLNSIVSCMAD